MLQPLPEEAFGQRSTRFAGIVAAIIAVTGVVLFIGIRLIGLDEEDISGTSLALDQPGEFAMVMVFVALPFVLGPAAFVTWLLFLKDRRTKWPFWILLGVVAALDVVLLLGTFASEGKASIFSSVMWTVAGVAIVWAGWRFMASSTWGADPLSPGVKDTVDESANPFPPILPYEHGVNDTVDPSS